MQIGQVLHVLIQRVPEAVQLHWWARVWNGLRDNGNLIAGIGACASAIASFVSIHNANKTRQDELARSKPDLQLTEISLLVAGDIHNTSSILFDIKNTKQNKLHMIEWITFLIYPDVPDTNICFYDFSFRHGNEAEDIVLGCPILRFFENRTKIVLITKTTDVFGNIGFNSYTTRFISRNYVPTDKELEWDFDSLPRSEVNQHGLTIEDNLIGYANIHPQIPTSLIKHIRALLKKNHSSGIDSILKESLNTPSSKRFLKRIYQNRFIRFLKSLVSNDIENQTYRC
jgi:hypothetical protein